MISKTVAAVGPPIRESTSARCAAFAEEVARVCHERGSWRRRLEWVRDVLTDRGADDPAMLGYLGVFLKLVATGNIASKEDGGHFRPSHQAEIGLDIERILLSSTPREARSLVRGILRYLPSHDLPFRRAEPLTRIRDIAHRNDIPHALKDEIKHSLQNKLHRSAGPEDLEKSEELLALHGAGCAVSTEGLEKVLAAVRAQLPAVHVSLTLEIHPHLLLTRKPLGAWAGLFRHWRDPTNAELVRAWLDEVTEQAALLRRLWASALPPERTM
jgi:hypothetical protein